MPIVVGDSTQQAGLCEPWCSVEDICPPCEDLDAELLASSIETASGILYRLSGRRYPGLCERTVRPLIEHGCKFKSADEITLGAYPINAIAEVKIDGEVLSPPRYWLAEHRTLIRRPDADGSRHSWPGWQRIDLESSEEDTFEVTFTYGARPPAGGATVAAELACELALACEPENAEKCRLPKAKMTNISRAGVSIQINQTWEVFADGFTGLPNVDLWIASVNPNKLKRRSRVISPDTRVRNRQVG